MRRNELFSKNVLKALSIGLSAYMALQPVAVMAESEEPSADTDIEQNENEDSVEESTVEETSEQAGEQTDSLVVINTLSSAQDDIKDAQAAVNNAVIVVENPFAGNQDITLPVFPGMAASLENASDIVSDEIINNSTFPAEITEH